MCLRSDYNESLGHPRVGRYVPSKGWGPKKLVYLRRLFMPHALAGSGGRAKGVQTACRLYSRETPQCFPIDCGADRNTLADFRGVIRTKTRPYSVKDWFDSCAVHQL